MKTTLLNIIFCAFILSGTTCFSQEEDQFSTVFSSKENSLNLLSQFSNNQVQNSSIVIQNSVIIQQIGNENNALADIEANISDVKLNQLGDNNSIYLDKSATEINQFIAQDGNNNSVIDFNYNSNNTINSNFSQMGNNLNIVNIGSNSISKELTVNQTGNSGSVIILNN